MSAAPAASDYLNQRIRSEREALAERRATALMHDGALPAPSVTGRDVARIRALLRENIRALKSQRRVMATEPERIDPRTVATTLWLVQHNLRCYRAAQRKARPVPAAFAQAAE